MKLFELLSGVELLGGTADSETEISGVRYDSREVGEGDLFVAISGMRTDGHLFIRQAVLAGARVIVTERLMSDDAPQLLVRDSRRALAVISANFYGNPSKTLKVIGVTGTNGKTTVSYLVRAALERATGKSVGLIGTNEIIIGGKSAASDRTTPESCGLQRMLREILDAGSEYAVMEVSSHALKLRRVDCVEFEAGIFTNLTQDHLDFHKSMEDYLESKARLFSMCALGIINIDDCHASYIIESASCKVKSFSVRGPAADYLASNIKLNERSVEFDAITGGGTARLRLPIPGRFSVYNALAAYACCLELGVAPSVAAGALGEARGVTGRAEVVPTGSGVTVIIDYAHTPDGLENILETVRGFARGRVICVFGCGGDRDAKKRPIMGEIAVRLSDLAVITSDNPRTEDPESIIREILDGTGEKRNYIVAEDRAAAIWRALDEASEGDVVLLAGKGHETYQEQNGQRRHMDEREIVKAYFDGKRKRGTE